MSQFGWPADGWRPEGQLPKTPVPAPLLGFHEGDAVIRQNGPVMLADKFKEGTSVGSQPKHLLFDLFIKPGDVTDRRSREAGH